MDLVKINDNFKKISNILKNVGKSNPFNQRFGFSEEIILEVFDKDGRLKEMRVIKNGKEEKKL